MAPRSTIGPGITKVRAPRIVERRSMKLLRFGAVIMGELIDEADVLSEGALHNGAEPAAYCGTTSLRIGPELLRRYGVTADDLVVAARFDGHLRTRIVRIAHREVVTRVSGSVDTLRIELTSFVASGGTFEILADVSAHLASDETRAAHGR